MNTLARLGAVGAMILAITGCSTNDGPKSASNDPGPSASKPISVVAHSGDVAPTTLHARPELTALHGGVYLSQALPAGTPLFDEAATPAIVMTTDALKIAAKGTAAATQTLPIDSTGGAAMLYLGPQLDDPAQIDAALNGIKVFDPDGTQINLRAAKMTVGGMNPKPMSAVPLGQHKTGTYTVSLDPIAIKAGVALDVRQPASSIAMKMRPSTYEHLLGVESDVVDMFLDEAGTGIPGANVVGTLIDPDMKAARSIVFKDVGQGHYQASLGGATFTAADKIGGWLVDIQATGKSPKGLDFLRSGRTGFHFGVPTARITTIGATRTIKNPTTGLIDAFELDVSLESSALDRLELSATLSTRTSDGVEHPVVIAFAGDAYDPGMHTVTLRFDAGMARATHLAGAYEIRNLKVFSIGTNTLFQRIANVNATGFSASKITDLAPLKEVPPGIAALIEDGKLYRE